MNEKNEKNIRRFSDMLEEFEDTNVDFYNYDKFLTKVNTVISSIQEMIRNNNAVIAEDKEEIRKVTDNPKIKSMDWSDSIWYRLFNLQQDITTRYEEQVIAGMAILIEFQEMIINKTKKIFDSIRNVSEEKIRAETTKAIYDDIKQMFLDLRSKDKELYESIIKDIVIKGGISNQDNRINERLDALEDKIEKLARITENLVTSIPRQEMKEDKSVLSEIVELEKKFSERKSNVESVEMPKEEPKKDIEGFRNYLIETARKMHKEGKNVKLMRAGILSTETRTGRFSKKYGLSRKEIEDILTEVISDASLYTTPA